MPDRTPCIFCDTVGLVRHEHVIKGGQSLIEHYCGHCNREWTTTEDGKPAGKSPSGPGNRDQRGRS